MTLAVIDQAVKEDETKSQYGVVKETNSQTEQFRQRRISKK